MCLTTSMTINIGLDLHPGSAARDQHCLRIEGCALPNSITRSPRLLAWMSPELRRDGHLTISRLPCGWELIRSARNGWEGGRLGPRWVSVAPRRSRHRIPLGLKCDDHGYRVSDWRNGIVMNNVVTKVYHHSVLHWFSSALVSDCGSTGPRMTVLQPRPPQSRRG